LDERDHEIINRADEINNNFTQNKLKQIEYKKMNKSTTNSRLI